MRQFRYRFGPGPTWLCALLLLGVASASSSAYAQAPGGQVVDRAQLLRSQPTLRHDPYEAVTGTDANHAEASPNDPDLGEQAILKRQEHYRAFTVSVASPIFYTSNVALVRTGEEDDVIFAPEIGITYAPRLTRTLYATVALEQQQFYYSRFGELDFGSFDARLGLAYHIPQFRNLLLRAEYNYNRLTADGFDEFFSDHSIFLNAELPFRIGRAQQFALGTSAKVAIDTAPEQPGRHDFEAYVGYSANLTRSLTATAVARIAVRDYVEGERTDVSEVLALGATYRFTKWLSASATSTLAWNQSDEDVFEYDVANVGAALAFSYRF
ncbi:MAG: hypothetical protein AVDCRST_MAG42-2033 [uncultured Chthoniobacterales bacterium]|uniref:Outer membrane protein beta-barrel domain-containing protein n=1 Tax=uncultured Chthoniobacterales bacterium TaxID=1836801 RepID=A0A6J4IAE9_9BACT|nr:MAG: hypothetical protein AVDCRST_MAG42-2033 [uncultured Chthoniobacterales bacterium]